MATHTHICYHNILLYHGDLVSLKWLCYLISEMILFTYLVKVVAEAELNATELLAWAVSAIGRAVVVGKAVEFGVTRHATGQAPSSRSCPRPITLERASDDEGRVTCWMRLWPFRRFLLHSRRCTKLSTQPEVHNYDSTCLIILQAALKKKTHI